MTYVGPETIDFNTTGALFRYIYIINPNLLSIFLIITFIGMMIYQTQKNVKIQTALFTSSFFIVIVGMIFYSFGVLSGWGAMAGILLFASSLLYLIMSEK